MKSSLLRAIPALIMLIVVLPQSLSANSRATSNKNMEQPSGIGLASPFSGAGKCNIALKGRNASDQQAPCSDKVFSSTSDNMGSSASNMLLPLANVTKSYTCGAVITNGLQTVVSKLSETVSVTWDPNGGKLNSATRSSWVLNSAYGWTNLSGPTPKSASWGSNGTGIYVETYGANVYLGKSWYTYHLTIHLMGTQSNQTADCWYSRY